MSTTLYYGEIAAKISANLHQNPAHVNRIAHVMNNQDHHCDSIWTICADAAKVFDNIEDLSSEHYINWHKALDNYSDGILNFLLSGNVPNILDMVSIFSRSIDVIL